MSDLELCMKWAANCKRCPRNRRCEDEYRKEMEQKSGGVSAKDLQVLWDSRRGSYMPTQKKPGEKGRQAERQIQKDKSVDREKQRDPSKG